MATAAVPDPFAFGHAVVRTGARQLLIDGNPAKLGARAFDLLLALIERRDRVASKNELLDIVWPALVVEENNLQVHISALRKLLGPAVIVTIPGRGYRFTAIVDADGGGNVALPPPATSSGMATADSAPGNLPPHLQPLFGRDDDLQRLLAQIETHPMVTVVGAAGVGKTALARAAARALCSRWRDGAWFVELASLSDPAQLPHAAAQALNITLSASPASASVQDQLLGVLGSQSLLLVLDNCEHLADAAGALAEAVVARAPGVRLLATSQELLNVPDETLFTLKPLAVPAADAAAADVGAFGAVRLFSARAQAVDPRFELSPANAQVVVDICRRLDGLPLAIELAAARVRMLGLQGLRDRLGERFRVLTGGARTAMRRHQTLRAAIDWSHSLLSPAEQAVLRRLGVFVGGFTLELVQQLAHDESLDEWAVLDALSTLVDKSLVVADAGEPPRYGLLETTRAYALEKLGEAGETGPWIERHARTVCALFERVEEARFGEQGTLSMDAFLRELSPELDNARAALDWAMGSGGDLALAIRLAGASAEVFREHGLAYEALGRMSALQAHVDETVDPLRAALFWVGLNRLGNVGRLPKALLMHAAEHAQSGYRTAAARRRLYETLISFAWSVSLGGEPGAVESMLAEIEGLEDPSWPPWLRAYRLNLAGAVYQHQHRFEDALVTNLEQQAMLLREPGEQVGLLRSESNLCHDLNLLRRYEDTIAIARSAVTRERGRHSGYMAALLHRLMYAQIFLGLDDDAWQTMHQAMPGWQRDGFVFYASALLAALLAERGRWHDAARLGGAARAYQRRGNIEHIPSLQRTCERLQGLLAAAACDPADIERWQREGEALDEAAIAAICLRDEAPGSIPATGHDDRG